MNNLLFISGTSTSEFQTKKKHPTKKRSKTSRRKERFYYPDDSYWAIVPKNLCFDTLINHLPVRVTKEYEHEFQLIDKIAGLLDIILRKYLDSYKVLDFSEEVFISASKTFKPFYDEYSNIIDFLIYSNVIEIVTKYKKGINTNSYRLTERYRSDGTRYYYIKDKSIVSKLTSRSSHKPTIERYPHLHKCIQDVRIDKAGALELAKKLLEGDKNRASKMSLYEKVFDRINSLTPNFKKDQNSGRLHTSITNLKREFKQFLSIDGLPLVGLDIKTSQPFFLASLLNDRTWENFDVFSMIKKHSKHLSDEEIDEARSVLRKNRQFTAANRLYYTGPASIESPPLYPASYFNSNSYKKSDLATNLQMHRDFFTFQGTYSDLVVSGMLYEFICWNFDLKTRDEGKDEMWLALYNPPRFMSKGRAFLETYFPEVVEFSDIINKGYNMTKKMGRTKADQSSTMALMLQSLEAAFMLDSLVPYIQNSFPGMPLFTIHDSLLVPKGYEDKILLHMERYIGLYLGLLPTIKVE